MRFIDISPFYGRTVHCCQFRADVSSICMVRWMIEKEYRRNCVSDHL